MTRCHEAVKAVARVFAGKLLMCSVLACSITHVAFARQDSQQLPADHDGQAQLMARDSANVTRLHIDDESAVPQFDDVRLPPNLKVSAPLRPILESMLRDSLTFRRQCARLTNSSSLTVSLQQVIIAAAAGSQAVTEFSFDRTGRMFAHVQLGQAADREAVIAHEFEHIIEQLDGVDLPSLARRATAGVHLTEHADRYETDRAVATARQVSNELRTARQKRM
jgi:hypothetical protein